MKRERSHSHDSASSSLSSKASGESPLGTTHMGLPPRSETGKDIQGHADPGLLVRTQGLLFLTSGQDVENRLTRIA